MIKGIYKINNRKLEIYNNDEIIVEELVENPSDSWYGVELDNKMVDFNIWEDGTDNYKLTLYPEVIVDQQGYYSTNPFKHKEIQLITI